MIDNIVVEPKQDFLAAGVCGVVAKLSPLARVEARPLDILTSHVYLQAFHVVLCSAACSVSIRLFSQYLSCPATQLFHWTSGSTLDRFSFHNLCQSTSQYREILRSLLPFLELEEEEGIEPSDPRLSHRRII